MGAVDASLQIQFGSLAADFPLELVVDDTEQVGNKPVEVEYLSQLTVFAQSWLLASIWGINPSFKPLENMLSPGMKRVKAYCSLADSPSIRILVDNGETTFTWTERSWKTIRTNDHARGFLFGGVPPSQWSLEPVDTIHSKPINTAILVGRRYDPVVEALTWSGEMTKRLRYHYDRPDVEIIQRTKFRDRNGQVVPDPVYNSDRGEFSTTDEAIGALVVRYRPGYTLFSIVYDIGRAVSSAELFAEMQRAWVLGDIKKAEVPPVRLIALSDKAATTASFAREFWPNGFPQVKHVDDARQPTADTSSQEWNDNWQEVAGTRQTTTRRVYDPNNTDNYIDIETFTYIEGRDDHGRTFKLRMLN